MRSSHFVINFRLSSDIKISPITTNVWSIRNVLHLIKSVRRFLRKTIKYFLFILEVLWDSIKERQVLDKMIQVIISKCGQLSTAAKMWNPDDSDKISSIKTVRVHMGNNFIVTWQDSQGCSAAVGGHKERFPDFNFNIQMGSELALPSIVWGGAGGRPRPWRASSPSPSVSPSPSLPLCEPSLVRRL